jgi:DNA-binding MarR family transcriptional regulator
VTAAGRDDRANALLDLAVANSLASELFDRELVRLGIRPVQVGVLLLVAMLGPVTPTVLERESGMAGTTLRERLSGLIAEGYVLRSPNPDDRRSYFVETTGAGEDYLTAAMPALRASERMLAQEIDLPVAELRALLARLRAAARMLVVGRDPALTTGK